MPFPRSLHSAFGLTIASDVPLVELPPGDGEPDVIVTLGEAAASPPASDSWSVTASQGEARGWASGAGAFRVSGGSEIAIEPMAGADERALRLAIVGPLLGVILAQRGRFVLHASTVMIDGVAAAFSGPSGRGKSTLAAALARAGHPLIADDITVIETEGERPVVRPGFPRVKLWPDSADALRHDVGSLPLIHPARTKRSVQVAAGFRPEAVPLARCYLLEDGEEESVSPMPGKETIISLIQTTYQASWLHESGVSGPNLLHCGSLARSGVVRRLRRRRSFEALPEVIRFIEADVRSASP